MSKCERGGVYTYMHVMKYNKHESGIDRNTFVNAVKAELSPIERRETEGVKICSGYLPPLYMQPMFQRKIAFGKNGFPWTSAEYGGNVS